MPDYQQMYLTMIRASEAALRELESAQAQIIAAQQACEELYLSQSEPELTPCREKSRKNRPRSVTGGDFLFHGDAFCEVSGLINITAALERHIVGE